MLNTKKDFQECFQKIVEPVKKYYTKGAAGIKCGSTGVFYGSDIALMEGFARILWGLAPFWCGGGCDNDFKEIYLKGIANGTNLDHEEYWGEIGHVDQRMVETAAMGLALILAPDKIWEPLSKDEKRSFYNWLNCVNEVKPSDNNWNLFPVIVNLGFKTVGLPYNREVVEKLLERIESFYIGDGWYTDGKSKQIDYYIAFAIHFYSLIYAKVMEKDDPKRSRVMKKRAEQFAKDFIYYFSDDGSALAFGRSMTYRFAQCCFWSACVYVGIEPFPMGVMKGIISRNIEWWLEKDIFDNGGILSIGYAYPNLCMSEEYNAFGSPYWALKSFLILALDDEHPFFKAEVLPLPKLDDVHIIKKANMVIQRINGYVVGLTAGQWAEWNPMHVAEKYSKFAYSSKYGFCVPRSYFGVENSGCDSTLAFVRDNMCYVRRKCMAVEISDSGEIYSKWSPLSGVEVETTIIPTETGHIRRHTVMTDDDITAYDCSFATPDGAGDINGDGEKILMSCAPNSNLMHPETKLKAIKYKFNKGTTSIKTEVIYL